MQLTRGDQPSPEGDTQQIEGAPPDQTGPADTSAPADAILTTTKAKHVLEAALVVAHSPLTLADMVRLFDQAVGPDTLRQLLHEITLDYASKGVELVCIEAGWRLQCRREMLPYLERGKKEKPPRYSAAAMETLATIAYRQPVTRADIEQVRGVSVSSQVLQQFLERDWIEIIGHREAPGRPPLYATTRKFLEDLGLESLGDLPIPDGLLAPGSSAEQQHEATPEAAPQYEFAFADAETVSDDGNEPAGSPPSAP